MTKVLKPGQLCTIKGHVYRCKKTTNNYKSCADCKEANHSSCILIKNGFYGMCTARFGMAYYPVLVK